MEYILLCNLIFYFKKRQKCNILNWISLKLKKETVSGTSIDLGETPCILCCKKKLHGIEEK